MPAAYTLNHKALADAATTAGDTTGTGAISPTRVSKRTGIDSGQISRHIRGISRPDLDTLIALGRAYRRPFQDFILLTEEPAEAAA